MTDRWGTEYEVVFDGRQELLPARASGPHPLSLMGHSDAMHRRDVPRTRSAAAKDREYQQRSKRLKAAALAACMRAE